MDATSHVSKYLLRIRPQSDAEVIADYVYQSDSIANLPAQDTPPYSATNTSSPTLTITGGPDCWA